MRRIFVDSFAGDRCVIEGDEHRHLQVLRIRVGDKLEACCGDGFVYFCKVVNMSKEQTTIEVFEKRIDSSETEVSCDLFVGILKGEHMEIAVQKCTELGINSINPIITENTVKTDTNVARLQKIALEAAKQSGRGKVPKISSSQKIAGILGRLSTYDLVVFPYEKAIEPDLRSLLGRHSTGVEIKNVAIIIGAEGGFTDMEADNLSAFAIPVTLGPRILRADTACIATTMAVMLAFDQMKRLDRC